MINKGKYTNKIVDDICIAISNTGKDIDGIKAGRIHKDTFYRWLKNKSDFSDKVARAKEQFRASVWKSDPDLYAKAVKGLKDHINGYFEEWRTVTKYPDGKQIIKTTTVKRAPSKWAIELVLGMNISGENSEHMLNTQPLIEAMNVITTLCRRSNKNEEK